MVPSIETRGGQIGVPDLMDLVVGRITVHPDGYAFVEPERKVEDLAGDLFVAGMHVNEAMHGDRVLARIERRQAGGRADGRVLRVLERRSATVVGRFDVDGAGLRYVTPFDRRLTQDVQIPRGEERGAAPGDMVTVDITRWPSSTRGPLGRVIEVLGDIDAPGVDLQVVIRKHGLPDVHSDDAIAEAVRLGGQVREADLRDRTDFRGLPTVTIDGEHARDFDDAITLSRLPNGNHWLGVHIADVGHYVAEGSALDRDARERATSVYFPERALHMFPAELATGLCSLNPHVDRLVQSCLMEVDRHGDGRARGVPRRRDPLRRADDVYRRQRHPHRPRQGPARGARGAWCRCSTTCTCCSASSTRAAGSAARSTSTCPRPRCTWIPTGPSRRSSPLSATWRTG